jgi:hypothetical protein
MVMSENIIHVTVHDGTQDELEEMRDFFEEALEDYDGSGKIVVSDENIELHELPQLETYTEILAERVAEKLEE